MDRERKVNWEEMFPDELLKAIEEGPVCYCAYGLAEPHGTYNALGLDWLKAQALVERAARQYGGIVAPPCAWHMQDNPSFPWLESIGVKQSLCSSIPPDLFYRLAMYQIRAIDARGFQVGILITGHYGGLENDLRLLCEYYLRRTGSPLRLYASADWELIRFEDYSGDHAGICETSQLMALRPNLVDLERKEETSISGPWAGVSFPYSDGRMPSGELGEKIVHSQIKKLGEIQRELLDKYKPRKDWKAPSLNDTEDIWHRFERLTRKYWRTSRTLEEYRKALEEYRKDKKLPLPKFPGWDAFGE